MTTLKNKRMSHDLNDDIEKIKAALALTANDVRGKATDAFTHSFENVKDKSIDLQSSVEKYVKARPFKSLGITMLSGLILGYAMHKKKRHNSHRS